MLEIKRCSLGELFFRYFFPRIRNPYLCKEFCRILGRTLLERTQSILVLVTVVNGGKKIAIGYGAMRKLPPKFLFASDNSFVIGPYYVDADYRGRGYGKNIINVLSDIAAEFYAEHMVKNLGGGIYAYVGIHNVASNQSFAANGFQVCGYMLEKDKQYYKVSEQTDLLIQEKVFDA